MQIENRKDIILDLFAKDHSNSKQQFKIWAKLANKDIAKYQYLLGICYEAGIEVKKSYTQALLYYKLAADQNYIPAQLALADIYTKQSHTNIEGINYYLTAANQGHPKAQFLIAKYYEEGFGESKENTKQAMAYYKLAASQGNSEAICRLAYFYENGIETEKDPEKAFTFYKIAADNNQGQGLYEVANCYKLGFGTEKSLEKAIEYYQRAIDLDYKKEQAYIKIKFCKTTLCQSNHNEQGMAPLNRKIKEVIEKNSQQTFFPDHILCLIEDYFPNANVKEDVVLLTYIDQVADFSEDGKTVKCCVLKHLNFWNTKPQELNEIIKSQNLIAYLKNQNEEKIFISKSQNELIESEEIKIFAYPYLDSSRSTSENIAKLIENATIINYSIDQFECVKNISLGILTCQLQLNFNKVVPGSFFRHSNMKIMPKIDTLVEEYAEEDIKYFYLKNLKIKKGIIFVEAINKSTIKDLENWHNIVQSSLIIKLIANTVHIHREILEDQLSWLKNSNNNIPLPLIIKQNGKFIIYQPYVFIEPIDQRTYEVNMTELENFVDKMIN